MLSGMIARGPGPVIALFLLASVGAAAGEPTARTPADPPVRVYTNADLEGLEPLPTQSLPAPTGRDPGWEFVTDFIARERRQIEEDRRYRMDRTLLDVEIESRRDPEPRYALAYAPYGFYPGRRHDARRPPHDRPGPSPQGRIVPLHARPSDAQLLRQQVIRQSSSSRGHGRPRPRK
jgi:hypothetical protein